MKLYMCSQRSNHVFVLERQAPAATGGRSQYHGPPMPELEPFSVAHRDGDSERWKSLNTRQGYRIPRLPLLVLRLLGQKGALHFRRGQGQG